MYLWQEQKRFKLTKEMVDEAEPNSIIHSGIYLVEHPWFNDAKTIKDGGLLSSDGRSAGAGLVVYRGGIADWCIYDSFDANFTTADYLDDPNIVSTSPERIARSGRKQHREEMIRSIVDCSDETFEMYRH